MQTPWGPSQHIETIAPGIQFVSTAGHGGFKLDSERNNMVPIDWRAASFNGQGRAGWYEEDCDAVLVALTFPEHFADMQDQARTAFASYFAGKGIHLPTK